MKDREGEDFSDVLTGLPFRGGDIVPVASKFTNAAGVYYSEKADDGFKYVAAFATKDERGMTWLEIFSVKQDGTKMVLVEKGRAGSKFLGRNPEKDEINREAVDMIKRWLGPH